MLSTVTLSKAKSAVHCTQGRNHLLERATHTSNHQSFDHIQTGTSVLDQKHETFTSLAIIRLSRSCKARS